MCQALISSTTAAPVTITIAWTATEKAIASVVGAPLAIRIAAPAPACVAAPAGAIGSAAEAAVATRKARASGKDAPPIARAGRSRKIAVPRSGQEKGASPQAAQ